MTLEIKPASGASAEATPQQILDIKTALGIDAVDNAAFAAKASNAALQALDAATAAAFAARDPKAPVPLADNTVLTAAAHANRELVADKATAIQLTIGLDADTGAGAGTKFYGFNRGAGLLTFVTTGLTLVKVSDLPDAREQGAPFEFRWIGTNTYGVSA